MEYVFYNPIFSFIPRNRSNAWRGVILFRSAESRSSLSEDKSGSSSWKKDNCREPSLSILPSFTLCGLTVFFFPFHADLTSDADAPKAPLSSCASVFSADSSTWRGIPAILATCRPKLWATPPSTSLRRKMTFFPTSFTAIWKLRTRG